MKLSAVFWPRPLPYPACIRGVTGLTEFDAFGEFPWATDVFPGEQRRGGAGAIREFFVQQSEKSAGAFGRHLVLDTPRDVRLLG